MSSSAFIRNALSESRRYKETAEKAIAQIPDAALYEVLDEESNSIAMLIKHLAGNLTSRWSDFLITDGDKPGRNRDAEFTTQADDTRENLLARWEAGWNCLFSALERLQPEDLEKTVTIRSEPCTVLEAIHRGILHAAYHVGQIVFLAKHSTGGTWQSLSIPRGKSEEYRAAGRPADRHYWRR